MTVNSNQFRMTDVKGKLDLSSINSLTCLISSAQVGSLLPAQPVKLIDTLDKLPVIAAVESDTDDIFGFINFSVKDTSFAPGTPCEVSILNNVMYMEASAGILRGAPVAVVLSGIKIATAVGNQTIIGIALDKASASGDYIRVWIKTPMDAQAIVGVAEVDLKDQPASVPLTELFTPEEDGIFILNFYYSCTLAGTAGTVKAALNWHDDTSPQTIEFPEIDLTTEGQKFQQSVFIKCKAGEPVSYSATLAGGVGSPEFSLYVSAIVAGTNGASIVGPQGTQGDPGEGVPAGGTAGQGLAKIDGTNYNTEWVNFVLNIIVDTTLTVKASGGDFTSITDALTFLKSKRIHPAATVTISVDPGLFVSVTTILHNHPDGDRIKIVGATPVSTAITSLASQSGSAGNYSVVLNVTSSAGMAIGDYAIVNSSTGTGEHRAIMGCWEITGIPSPSQITVKNSYRKAAWPTLTVTGGNVKCLKTILKFMGCDGFTIGNPTGKIYNIAIVGNGTSYDGINISQRGTYYGGKVAYFGDGSGYCVGVNGFGRYGVANTAGTDLWLMYFAVSNCTNYGVYAYAQAKIAGIGIIASGNGNIGIYSTDGAYITCTYSFAVGNSTTGFYANSRAGMNAQNSEAVGNIQSGFQCNIMSSIDATSSKALNNSNCGYKADSGSTIYATSTSAVGNGLAAGQYGYYALNGAIIRANTSTGSGNFAGDYRAEDKGYIRVTSYTGSPTFSPALDVLGNGNGLIRNATAVLVDNNGGTWANRPAVAQSFDGRIYFDTGLKKPYFYNSSDATWYDANGVAHV
jgi:hypothetical protein